MHFERRSHAVDDRWNDELGAVREFRARLCLNHTASSVGVALLTIGGTMS
jgi:hypothetical protein